MPRSTLARLTLLVVALVVSGTGCTAERPAPATPPPPPTTTSAPPSPSGPSARTAMPADATAVVAGTGAVELAVATSRALFRHAPAVVLAGEGDNAAGTRGEAVAVELGVPLLPAPRDAKAGDGVRAELKRLAPRTVVTVGDAAAAWARKGIDATVIPAPPTGPVRAGRRSAAPSPTGAAPTATAGPDSQGPLDVSPAEPLGDLLVLALNRPANRAATATARAAGARVVVMANPDPRVDSKVIASLAGQATERVLALGSPFGPAERLRRRVDTAATGVLLPGGGQVVFPGRRMIALYGHPGSSVLGSLGEQSLSAAITRARKVARAYRAPVGEPVIPAFEIITTIAAASAGPDGDYSTESSVAKLRPWVDAARRAGVYVMLDLQPGRTDFLTQAKRYAELLRAPHVGLALDPEWRLGPNERHMVQIGSVDAAEVNRTAAWLAELTRTNKLPQKVLMLHQFRLDMITNRSTLDTSHDELRIVIHADGFGTASQKYATWRALHRGEPANISWGWKNFYDEDKPTFTPAETMAVRPSPVFISYQ
jgi:hypothetical protein